MTGKRERGKTVFITQKFAEEFMLGSGGSRISSSTSGLLEVSVHKLEGAVRISGFLMLRTCVVGIFSAGSDILKKRRCQMEIISFLPIGA